MYSGCFVAGVEWQVSHFSPGKKIHGATERALDLTTIRRLLLETVPVRLGYMSSMQGGVTGLRDTAIFVTAGGVVAWHCLCVSELRWASGVLAQKRSLVFSEAQVLRPCQAPVIRRLALWRPAAEWDSQRSGVFEQLPCLSWGHWC